MHDEVQLINVKNVRADNYFVIRPILRHDHLMHIAHKILKPTSFNTISHPL